MTRILSLFTSSEEAEAILGDLHEEFSHLPARRFYWQIVRTIAHLAVTGFQAAPWSTAAAVIGGFLLIKLSFRLPTQAIEAVLDRSRVWESSPHAYVFLLTRGGMAGRVLIAMLTGCIVALASKGREMTATLALAIFMFGLSGFLMLIMAVTGNFGFVRTLPEVIAFSIAVVLGGMIVAHRRRLRHSRESHRV